MHERPKVSQLANGSECDPPIRTEDTKINIQLVHTKPIQAIKWQNDRNTLVSMGGGLSLLHQELFGL